jgi:uncharacterized small protein (DUF1192 family)
MATKSIIKNIEISDPAEAEKLVKALEEAKKICDGAHFCVEGCEACEDNEYCDFRESEEGMEIDTLKERFWKEAEKDESFDIGELACRYVLELEQKIQAQQQEIDWLKARAEKQQKDNEMLLRVNKKLGDKIQALCEDKDEQAGRLMKMDYLLRRTLPILEVTNDQQGLIDAINALLGGTKDKPLKPAGNYETFVVPGKAPVIQGETAKSILSELGGKEGGTWINGYCSNCNSAIPTDSKDDYIANNECRFCYYCGAKMAKEEAEEALGGTEG